MARRNINVGTNLNDGTGDRLRDAMSKVNENFIELYETTLSSGNVTVSDSVIETTNVSDPDLTLKPAVQGNVNVVYGLNVNTDKSVCAFHIWSNDHDDINPLVFVDPVAKQANVNGTLTTDNLSITNDTIAYSNVQIGSSTLNYLTLLSQVQGDIIPAADSTNYIGSPSKKYITGYFNTVETSIINTGDITTTNANINILRVTDDAFLGDFLIRNSMISNRVPNNDIEIRPDGTGKVIVSSKLMVGSGVDTGETAQVNGDTIVNGNLTVTGNVLIDGGSVLGDKTIITFVIDGGLGETITPGSKRYLGPMNFGGTISSATLLADQTGSIEIEIRKCSYADFDAGVTHPVSGDAITASAPVTLVSAAKSQDTTLTGWTTSFATGDIFEFVVNSATTVTWVEVTLAVTKV